MGWGMCRDYVAERKLNVSCLNFGIVCCYNECSQKYATLFWGDF